MNQFYKKVLFAILLLSGGLGVAAQVSVTATTGTVGPTAYTTLKAAFDAVNAGTHSGNVTVTVSGNTTETGTATLNSGPYSTLTLNATAASVITGNIGGPLIDFVGAGDVFFNGNNNLQLVNTNSGGPVLHFVNDAGPIKIRNTKLKGAYSGVDGTGAITGGIVLFDVGSSAGNNDNLITGCDLDGGSTAICGVFSKGDATTSLTENFADSIVNCTIHDVINPAVAASTAIFLSAGNDKWVLSGNSIYNTVPVVTAVQFPPSGITIFPSWTSDAHIVTGNYVGGSTALAGGTALTITNNGAGTVSGYIGMSIQTGGTGSAITNNTIRNIAITYGSTLGSFSNAGIFSFIGGYNGTSTISGNTIKNISITNTLGTAAMYGIQVNGRVTSTTTPTVTPTFNILNNTIDTLTSMGGGAFDAVVYGVRLDASSGASLTSATKSNPTYNVTGNTIYSLNAPWTGTSATVVRGIGAVTAQGTSSTSLLYPKVRIRTNTIYDLNTNSAVGTTTANSQFAASVVTGIHYAGSAGTPSNTIDTAYIQQNTIYGLNALNTGDVAVVATGIYASVGIHDISRNKIYDIKNAASGATTIPGIVGISVRGITGGSMVYNNFISLGTGQGGNMPIYGILQPLTNTTAGQSLGVYYNSVHIAGTGSGTRSTSGFYRGDPAATATAVATPVIIKNNIFQNLRSGGTGSHFAVVNLNTAASWVSDYNDLSTSVASAVAQWGTNSNDLATYKTNATDVNSKSFAVAFTNVATGDLHLSGASQTDANLSATPIIGITTDYDADARSATAPGMGADEKQVSSAVSNVNEELRSTLLMPSVVRNQTTLRLNSRSAMKITWMLTDMQGRVIRRFAQSVNAGQNDLSVSMQDLGGGTYQLIGYPSKGTPIMLRFVKL
jgi:hypothetical protein